MEVDKKFESVTDKQWRLEQIREQIKDFLQWFHPTYDEVAGLLYQAREWAKLADLELSKNELDRIGGDSVFFPLIRFCKDELGKIVLYCETRQSSGKGTLRDSDIQSIKQLCRAADLETVEQLCLWLVNVDIAGALARIMRTSYRALNNPGTLDELNISELRGDIFEVVAWTYADIITVMREEAAKGIAHGLAQVAFTTAATKARGVARKNSGVNMAELKARALKLKAIHGDWKRAAIARQLHLEFSEVSFHTIRKYDWLKKLT